MSHDPTKKTDEQEPKGRGQDKPGHGRPSQGHSGEAADTASDRVDDTDLDELNVEDRQDLLIDEAVEETFPASDPISPKHIT